jgi:hypothetical protein
VCSNDEIPGWGIVSNAKFQCKCNDVWYLLPFWSDDWETFCCCENCLGPVTVSIYMMNYGVDLQAEFDVGIEKYDKAIKSIYKETRVLLNNEKICCSFKLVDHEDYFLHGDIIKCVLTIKNAKAVAISALPMQPNVRLAKEFSEICLNTAEQPDPLVDVTLYVEERKIYGHRLILSLASKYFRRMFSTNMAEANNKEVYLEDIDFNTMQSLLGFIYSGSIEEEKITLKLLEAADRFEVMPLIDVCCQTLSKSINSENVAEIYETSYMHSMENLTHDCVIFMAQRWDRLSKDETIHQLAKKYSDLPITVAALLSQSSINSI